GDSGLRLRPAPVPTHGGNVPAVVARGTHSYKDLSLAAQASSAAAATAAAGLASLTGVRAFCSVRTAITSTPPSTIAPPIHIAGPGRSPQNTIPSSTAITGVISR